MLPALGLDRPVVAVGAVEFLGIDAALLIGLCSDCWSRPDRLQIAVAGLKRDFSLPEIEVATIHGGGRA